MARSLALLVTALMACSPIAADYFYGPYNLDEYEQITHRLEDCFMNNSPWIDPITSLKCPWRAVDSLGNTVWAKEDLPAVVAECLKEDWRKTEEQSRKINQCCVEEMAKPLQRKFIGLYTEYEVDQISRRVWNCFQLLPIDSLATPCIDLKDKVVSQGKTKEEVPAEISQCLAGYPLEASKALEITTCLEKSLGDGFETHTELGVIYEGDQFDLIDAGITLCENRVKFTSSSPYDNPAFDCTNALWRHIDDEGAAKNLFPGLYTNCLREPEDPGVTVLNLEETHECFINEMSKVV